MNARRWPAFAGILLISAVSGCSFGPKFWHKAELDLSVPAKDVQRLHVKTHNGAVTIVGEDGLEEVSVHVKKEGGGITPKEAAKVAAAIEPFAVSEGNTIKVGWKWKNNKRLRAATRVTFDVRVPKKFAARLTTHNGPIRVKDLQGDVKADSHNGGINVAGFENKLDLETHNGGIKAKGKSNEIRLDTHNGSIRAEIVAEAPLSGTVSTHNGAISLLLPEDVSTELTWDTHNGGVKLSVPLKDRKGKRKKGSGLLGDGGGRLRVSTHNGGIFVGTLRN